MPTVIVSGPYRLFFYSGDGNEPAHIHAQRDEMVAKFWLNPVRLGAGGGFAQPELREIRRLIEQNEKTLLGRWNEFFAR